MRTILILITTLATSFAPILETRAQGTLVFGNNAVTLISLHLPSFGNIMMPRLLSGGTNLNGFPTGDTFYFAVFIAPSTTVNGTGNKETQFLTDPRFQTVAAYGTNSTAVGRIRTQTSVPAGAVGGFGPGEAVDFIVRGWSANMGTTWADALADWNSGPQTDATSKWIGSSAIGNDLILGGVGPGGESFQAQMPMGPNPYQVLGFSLTNTWVPEPGSLALFFLCGLALSRFRRRNE